MKIGIDISQLAYPNAGVSNYLAKLVGELLKKDRTNQYVLFFSSMRKDLSPAILKYDYPNVKLKRFKMPPSFMNLMWNKLHIMPVEKFIGPVDIFLTSDWTEPPAKARKVTIIYDLIVYKYPQETHQKTEFNFRKLRISPNIVASQKTKLDWVRKESSKIFCISEGTAKDANEILGIDRNRLEVIYPGL